MFVSLAAGLAAAAASYAGYASMAPRSQLYGRTLAQGCDSGQIALTYDDGPNDPYTFHLLDMLAARDAKATFFLIGRYVHQRPDIARAIQQAGHAIGNHTYTHPNLIFVPPARVRRELEDCTKVLEDATGKHPSLFRPPFGGRLPHVLQVSRSLGLTPVMWSVTSYDWKAKSPDAIFDRVSKEIGACRQPRGEIVLLHDGSHLGFGDSRAHTIEATRRLLEKYSGENKKFVSVPDLAI